MTTTVRRADAAAVVGRPGCAAPVGGGRRRGHRIATPSRPLRALVFCLVSLLFAALPALPAQAHARLVNTIPGDTGIVDVGAADVRLVFNEQVVPQPGGFQLYDAAGNGRTLVTTTVDTDVRVTLPAGLAPASYLLSWRVVSGDGHLIAGTLSFGYGQEYRPLTPPQGIAAADPATAVVAGAVQVVDYLALLLLAGLAWFGAAVLRGDSADTDTSAAVRHRLVLGSGLVAVIATLALAPLTALVDGGAAVTGFTAASAWVDGFALVGWAPLICVLVGVAGVVLSQLLPAPAPSRQVVAVSSATLALASLALVGHTRTERPVWLGVGSDLVHVSAAAGWLGGLVGLALVLGRPHAALSAERAAVLVSRFSGLGAILVGALGLSGAAMSVLVLPTPVALISTDYGRTLLVKLGLVAVIAVLAVWNRLQLVPDVARRPDEAARWRRLRSAVRDETVILVAVVCLTGLLVALSPNTGAGTGQGVATQNFGGSLGSGATVSGSISPGQVGDNVVELTVRDTSGSLLTPVELPDVEATLADPAIGPIEATVVELTPGRYRATLPLAAPGSWDLEVFVRLDDEQRPSVQTTVEATP